MFGIFGKKETLSNPPSETTEEIEEIEEIEADGIIEEDTTVPLSASLELEAKIQERLAVFEKKIQDINNNFQNEVNKARGLRVCVSPDTLQYIVCNMEVEYPTYLASIFHDSKNPKRHETLEGRLNKIENGIRWCDAQPQYDITIHKVYASFWNLNDALEHLEYAKANKEKLGQTWE